MKPRIAIIGGGWAGCAAGLSLVEAGVAPTLFEASSTLGGRARGVALNGVSLDNGQHLLLGAYQQTLELIAKVWPDSHDALFRQPLALAQPPDFLLSCPKLPAPFHLLTGLLTAKGLTVGDKLAAARWMQALLRKPPAEEISVATLISAQPPTVRTALWEPLCVAALNTPAEYASAKTFIAILQTVFTHARAHSDLLFPRCDLTRLFPQPAANRMMAMGGRIYTQTRITHITPTNAGFALNTPTETHEFDRIIVAVAPQHLAKLIITIPALQEIVAGVATYHYEAIATLYLQYPKVVKLARPMLGLADGPAQFVFDRGWTHGQPGLLALVASAAPRYVENWAEQACEQLTKIAPLPRPLWQKTIIEKQATYSSRPQLYKPENCTPQPGLFLAGDYTASPYPATLESATLSGVKSAQLVLNSL